MYLFRPTELTCDLRCAERVYRTGSASVPAIAFLNAAKGRTAVVAFSTWYGFG